MVLCIKGIFVVTYLQSCTTLVFSVLTVYVWLKSSLRSIEVFKQIKSEDDSCITMHIHKYIHLQVLVNIKYQTHYKYE